MDTDNASTATSRFPRSLALIEEGMRQGLHTGAQLYVSRNGEVLIENAMDLAREGVPMSNDTLMLWLSAGKPIGAVAIAQLWERGKLQLDDRVSLHIPEFAAGGKEPITIRHLLTHTGGFRTARKWNDAPWEQVVAEVCASRLEPGWIIGRTAGYHATSSWIILGELVHRLDGRIFDTYVREEILEPLGMHDTWIGMPPERYQAYGNRIGLLQDTTKTPPIADFPGDTLEGATVCRPGSNARGPIRELGRFYEMFLNLGQLDGARILMPQTVEALTARHRVRSLDLTFRRVMDWGLGLICNSYGGDANPKKTLRRATAWEMLAKSTPEGEQDAPYGFGPTASARTYGHGGSQSSLGLCDPERRLVIAFIFNGACGEEKHHVRRAQLMRTLYEEVG